MTLLNTTLPTTKLPAMISLLVLFIVLAVALLREFSYSDEGMVHFNATTKTLGGESHPLLSDLRSKPKLHLDDVLGSLGNSTLFTPKQRLFVSRHEVTNEQYQYFLRQISAIPTSISQFAPPGTPAGHNFRPLSLKDIKYNGDKQPIINIDWHDAHAFCQFINMRLPTGDEFEALFAFEAGLRQPQEYDHPLKQQSDDLANKSAYGTEGQQISEEIIPREVASYKSSQGIFDDVIGNVMEWIQPSEGRHFLMGYSYKQYSDEQKVFYPFKRHYTGADTVENDYGFRCVYAVSNPDFLLDTSKPPTLSRNGVNCYKTSDHINDRQFALTTQANQLFTRAINVFPEQLCELPNKTYQLGPKEPPDTVDMIHKNRLGYAFYLLGDEPQSVDIAGYWLDKKEVSVNDYAAFVDTSKAGKQLASHPEAPDEPDHTPLNWIEQLNQNPLPVTGVNWWSAFAYCSWQNKRLPFASEWESAARGDDSRVYAWGNDSSAIQTPDITPQGITGLTRNVSEWTASFVLGSDAAIVKGGSEFFDWPVFGRAYAQLKLPRNTKSSAVGFRCARPSRG
jgi:formylglycine-generating enzyme required for sulfatase activity